MVSYESYLIITICHLDIIKSYEICSISNLVVVKILSICCNIYIYIYIKVEAQLEFKLVFNCCLDCANVHFNFLNFGIY